MKTDIPNPSLTHRLRNRYYSAESNTDDANWISSHWEYESQFLGIREAETGPQPISGAVWGCKWSGKLSKLVDRATILSHLVSLRNKRQILKIFGEASKICARMGVDPTYTVFRQVCSVELLQRYLTSDSERKRIRLIVIGDGIGMLSSVFKAVFPNSIIVMVDIGKSLMYQAYYVQRAYPRLVHEMVDSVTDMANTDFIYCPTEDLEYLAELQFDVGVNIASMQEMNSQTISRYFTFLREHFDDSAMFYCCNRDYKALVGGEVTEISNYPWIENDEFLVDEPCGWNRFYVSRIKMPSGPRLLGFRVPFLNHFDGTVSHRLAILDRTTKEAE